eukprot:TRINITY_DN12155_c0_g1_i1.p3 TRINITY_DN12155_c0_g1~~TRINITY_DN12155_c0_g1_i1.p3  ORF type:complete len:107 (-),score=1.18 TRINITY_DN12155_c0_g1_i1:157-477(-)
MGGKRKNRKPCGGSSFLSSVVVKLGWGSAADADIKAGWLTPPSCPFLWLLSFLPASLCGIRLPPPQQAPCGLFLLLWAGDCSLFLFLLAALVRCIYSAFSSSLFVC